MIIIFFRKCNFVQFFVFSKKILDFPYFEIQQFFPHLPNGTSKKYVTWFSNICYYQPPPFLTQNYTKILRNKTDPLSPLLRYVIDGNFPKTENFIYFSSAIPTEQLSANFLHVQFLRLSVSARLPTNFSLVFPSFFFIKKVLN